ncbi:MAG: carbohydrate ABC transporter permease, partial [Mesorhizobium sp.]
MAAVRTSSEVALNRIAIVAVLIATLIFLAPIYWIASKPKELAVSVPPTVLFEPEVTPFVRLFTKRVQMQKTVDPQVYEAAPWWEKRIYDGGERVLKVGKDVQLSQYPDRFMNSLIVAVIST